MQISLPEHQEAFVNRQARAAGYSSPDEWVQDLAQGAIFDRMLELDPKLSAEIDAGIERGLADVAAGRTKPLRQAAEEIKAKIRARRSLS